MWRFLYERIQVFADSAVSDHITEFNYAQFAEKAVLHGKAFQSRLPSGTKCAVLCRSGLNTALALLSCWYADLVAIPMSLHYGEKHCRAILDVTAPQIMITDGEDVFQDGFVYHIDSGRFLGTPPCLCHEEALEDVALILCTSGTTGKPKAAMITAEGLKSNVSAIARYFDIHSDDTILIARPLYHCAVLTGEFLSSFVRGLNIHFFDEKYSPAAMIDMAAKIGATVLCGTPTLFHHLSLLLGRTKVTPPVQVIALSGECLRSEIAVQIRKAFPKATIYHVYGLTEASPRVAYLPPPMFDFIPESVGIPVSGVKTSIVDPKNGKKLPANTPGLLMVKSPSIMKGYYQDAAATKRTIIDGWLNTRDIAVKDDNGYLYLLSRADDMIIKAGMNIYPKEIENAVSALPQIAEAVAYGIKSRTGQEIAVNVVLTESFGNTTVKQLLADFCDVLPSYQIPAKVNIVAALERNSSGKIVRPRQ
jgi:acyl-CoA synthetase (AMP-forming)/AMP-acid ligase II